MSDRVARGVLPVDEVFGRPMIPTMALVRSGEMPRLLVAYSPEEVLANVAKAKELIESGAGKRKAFLPGDLIGVYLSSLLRF